MLCCVSRAREWNSDFSACVRLPGVTESTPYTPLPRPLPHETFLAATPILWLQISSPAARLVCPHVHTRVEMTGHPQHIPAVPRPWVCPQVTRALPAHRTASLTIGAVPFLGPSKPSLTAPPRSEQGGHRASGLSQLWQVTGPEVCSGAGETRSSLE